MPRETPAGATTGTNGSDGNPTFTLSAIPATGTLIVIVDRLVQDPGVDYTLAGNIITFVVGSIPITGALIDCIYGASSPLLPAGGTPPWDTVTNLVSDAAIELGLVTAPITDVFGSTDQNIVQLRTLLKSGCRELGRLRDWTHIVKQTVFTTIQGTPNYALPADFRQMIDQSGWNRTNRLPLGGPLSAQEWEYLKARLVGVVFTVLFRPWQGQLYLYPDTNTPGGYSIAYEYISRYFVQPTGVGSPTSETPTANTDTICFEPQLVVKKLKLDFLMAKKMDYSAELESYEKALEMIKSDDSALPILRLNRQNMVDPLLGQQNVPLTGYG